MIAISLCESKVSLWLPKMLRIIELQLNIPSSSYGLFLLISENRQPQNNHWFIHNEKWCYNDKTEVYSKDNWANVRTLICGMRSLCCRCDSSAAWSHPSRNLTRKFTLNFLTKQPFKSPNIVLTSLALFRASAKAELGSNEAAAGGGTLLNAIASAIINTCERRRKHGQQGVLGHTRAQKTEHFLVSGLSEDEVGISYIIPIVYWYMIPFCTLSSSSQSESYLGNGAEMDRFNIITFAPSKLVVEQRGSDLLQRDGFFTFFSSCWTFFGKQCWPGWLSRRQNRTPTSVFWVACVFSNF